MVNKSEYIAKMFYDTNRGFIKAIRNANKEYKRISLRGFDAMKRVELDKSAIDKGFSSYELEVQFDADIAAIKASEKKGISNVTSKKALQIVETDGLSIFNSAGQDKAYSHYKAYMKDDKMQASFSSYDEFNQRRLDEKAIKDSNNKYTSYEHKLAVEKLELIKKCPEKGSAQQKLKKQLKKEAKKIKKADKKSFKKYGRSARSQEIFNLDLKYGKGLGVFYDTIEKDKQASDAGYSSYEHQQQAEQDRLFDDLAYSNYEQLEIAIKDQLAKIKGFSSNELLKIMKAPTPKYYETDQTKKLEQKLLNQEKKQQEQIKKYIESQIATNTPTPPVVNPMGPPETFIRDQKAFEKAQDAALSEHIITEKERNAALAAYEKTTGKSAATTKATTSAATKVEKKEEFSDIYYVTDKENKEFLTDLNSALLNQQNALKNNHQPEMNDLEIAIFKSDFVEKENTKREKAGTEKIKTSRYTVETACQMFLDTKGKKTEEVLQDKLNDRPLVDETLSDNTAKDAQRKIQGTYDKKLGLVFGQKKFEEALRAHTSAHTREEM